jgi:hypothetical protein
MPCCRRLGIVGILSVTVSGSAFAEPDLKSANCWLPFCRHVAAGHNDQGDAFMNGACAGLIIGLAETGQSIGVCAPESATREQAVRVVVRYLDQHPARTNEPFNRLAMEALREAWPCQR